MSRVNSCRGWTRRYHIAVEEPGPAEQGQAPTQPVARRDHPVNQWPQQAVGEQVGQVLVGAFLQRFQRLPASQPRTASSISCLSGSREYRGSPLW